MERVAITTTTYRTKIPGFLVDIVSSGKLYEGWLYHEEYGVKSHMFGCFKKDCTKQDFIEMIEDALDNQPIYIDTYRNVHMD